MHSWGAWAGLSLPSGPEAQGLPLRPSGLRPWARPGRHGGTASAPLAPGAQAPWPTGKLADGRPGPGVGRPKEQRRLEDFVAKFKCTVVYNFRVTGTPVWELAKGPPRPGRSEKIPAE